MSSKQNTVQQCQYQNSRGQRCHHPIDTTHRLANRAAPPTLCAYHVDHLKGSVPAVDPEVLAAELLTDIDSFTTADEVNLFLGNLVRQLARKRIARRDAIALAYISQLILTSQTAMVRETATEAEDDNLQRYLLEGLGRRSREALTQEQQLRDSSAAACPGAAMPASHSDDREQLAS